MAALSALDGGAFGSAPGVGGFAPSGGVAESAVEAVVGFVEDSLEVAAALPLAELTAPVAEVAVAAGSVGAGALDVAVAESAASADPAATLALGIGAVASAEALCGAVGDPSVESGRLVWRWRMSGRRTSDSAASTAAAASAVVTGGGGLTG